MNALAGLIDPLYGFVLESTAGASVIVCSVLILQRLFANWLTPRSRYLLWSVVLLRLILPWTPASPLSAQNIVAVASNSVPAQFAILPQTVEINANIAPTGVPPQAPPPPAGFDWHSALMLAWLAGCVGWSLHVFATCRRLPRALRGLQDVADARALAAFETCKAEMGVKRRVALCEAEIAYPLVCGLTRPRLVLPQGVTGRLTDGELRHVMLHELAHLKRSDLVVGVACAVLQAMHWFNPLVWYGFRRMRQDREYACDALALSHMPDGEAGDYGHTLIKLVQGGSPSARLAGVAGIAENKSELERRIRMIAKHASSRYRLTLAGLVLLALCGLLFLTRATAQPAEPTDEFPYVIEFETYETSWSAFRPGDSIEILEFRGTSPKVEAGQRYYVKGRYTLASEERAMLAWYCTNGDVSEDGYRGYVDRGEGEFTRTITLVKPGMLHLNYYPAGGGEGFGSTYFRRKSVPAGSPDAVVDLATSDADFIVDKWENSLGYRLIVTIRNEGNSVSPPFKIWFYEQSLAAHPRTHGGGPIAPGETWTESTYPVELKEGENTFYVKIDADDEVAETDDSNNTAKVAVQVKKVMREVLEVVE